MKKPIRIAFASPKGGVGKTTLTIMAANYFRYFRGCNVTVVDCNDPIHTISNLRQAEEKTISANARLTDSLQRSIHTPYPIISSRIDDAIDGINENLYADCNYILYDIPSLMSVEGTSQLLSLMDVVIIPVTGCPLAAQLVERYIEIFNEQVRTTGKGKVREILLLGNMIDYWESSQAHQLHLKIVDATGVKLLPKSVAISRHIHKVLLWDDTPTVSTLVEPQHKQFKATSRLVCSIIEKNIAELWKES